MTNTRDVILKLKEVRLEKNLSFDKILALMEQNGEFVSKSTLSRVFADGSEEKSFRYDETLRPIANALLDIETYEPDDDPDTLAFKSILRLKMSVIDENSKQISNLKEQIKEVAEREKMKYHEKLEEETEKFQRSLDFVKNQIELKDKRIDQLLDENVKLVDANVKLLNQVLECPLKNKDCQE